MDTYIKYPTLLLKSRRAPMVLGILLIAFTLFSCKKNASHCYQCDLQGNGTYQDMGCYSDEEWANYHVTDLYGTNIDKSQKCRQK